MRQFFFPYIATAFLFLFIVACQSHSEPVNANPRYAEGTKAAVNPINYEDTTNPTYQNIIRRLDSFYRVQSMRGFNGSVLVGYKGKVIYERYIGLANREIGLRLNPNNAVQLASISKTFTGAAILFLHEHKFLNINEKVKTYIPSFPYPELTIKMLLNHRAGLPDYIKWIPRFRKDSKTPITNKIVEDMFATHKPRLEFRADSRFKYSNSNYAILASVVEHVTELSFPGFMKKYFFEPLGMKNTFVHSSVRALPANASISYKYNWVREPDMYADGVYGDKNIYSTVEDMYRWDQSFYKNTLLSNETIELSYGPCSFEKPGIKNYGLGWRMLCYPDGDKVIYHNGWWHGNNTSFYRFIRDNFTIIILGNKYNSSIYKQPPVIYGIVNNVAVGRYFDAE